LEHQSICLTPADALKAQQWRDCHAPPVLISQKNFRCAEQHSYGREHAPSQIDILLIMCGYLLIFKVYDA